MNKEFRFECPYCGKKYKTKSESENCECVFGDDDSTDDEEDNE